MKIKVRKEVMEELIKLGINRNQFINELKTQYPNTKYRFDYVWRSDQLK